MRSEKGSNRWVFVVVDCFFGFLGGPLGRPGEIAAIEVKRYERLLPSIYGVHTVCEGTVRTSIIYHLVNFSNCGAEENTPATLLQRQGTPGAWPIFPGRLGIKASSKIDSVSFQLLLLHGTIIWLSGNLFFSTYPLSFGLHDL